MHKMLKRLIGEDIDLKLVLEPTLGTVKADPGQIEQVIMNLAVNARDAMPQGGKLTIETANVALDESYACRHIGVEPGQYVMLAVSDTGCGMDDETLSHIFEPFFTTKNEGQGTGLGLSTVYGIVKQSGGDIWVYSEPGRGTTFKVYLPRTEEAVVEGASAKSDQLECSRHGQETILLVEDEEMVRTLASEILQMSGYTVLEAEHGHAALQLSTAFAGRIHLMLTDVVMPEMSGVELARRLVSARPEMKVIYMSGYTDRAVAHHGLLELGSTYLQKPFTLDMLTCKIRQALDGDRR
jgi:CheY-like chemotaxis protein